MFITQLQGLLHNSAFLSFIVVNSPNHGIERRESKINVINFMHDKLFKLLLLILLMEFSKTICLSISFFLSLTPFHLDWKKTIHWNVKIIANRSQNIIRYCEYLWNAIILADENETLVTNNNFIFYHWGCGCEACLWGWQNAFNLKIIIFHVFWFRKCFVYVCGRKYLFKNSMRKKQTKDDEEKEYFQKSFVCLLFRLLRVLAHVAPWQQQSLTIRINNKNSEIQLQCQTKTVSVHSISFY